MITHPFSSMTHDSSFPGFFPLSWSIPVSCHTDLHFRSSIAKTADHNQQKQQLSAASSDAIAKLVTLCQDGHEETKAALRSTTYILLQLCLMLRT